MKAYSVLMLICFFAFCSARLGMLSVELSWVYCVGLVATLFVTHYTTSFYVSPQPPSVDLSPLREQLSNIQTACETNSQALSAILSKAV